MKKTAIAIAIALSTFTTAVQAVPKNKTWYIGAHLGFSRYHDIKYYGNGYRNTDGLDYKAKLGTSAFLGYQINPYVGLEFGYDWFGRIINKGYHNYGTFQSQGIQLTTKINYQLNKDFDLYTRLGGILWRVDAQQHNVRFEKFSDNDSGVSPLFAMGLEYIFNSHFVTRLDYQWANNIGDAGTVGSRPDNCKFSIGFSYRFNQEPDSGVAPISAVILPISISPSFTTKSVHNHTIIHKLKPIKKLITTKHFNLKSHVLFSFNKAILKQKGQLILDKLYNQINGMHAKKHSIIVLGFTDRLGKKIYNHKLSQQRAKSVVNYLLHKGISIHNISWRAMGAANPMTRKSCNNIKKLNALIKCLTPDRRVEIEVKGIQDITTH